MVEERFCVDCGKSSRAWIGAIEAKDGGVCGDCARTRCDAVGELAKRLREWRRAERVAVIAMVWLAGKLSKKGKLSTAWLKEAFEIAEKAADKEMKDEIEQGR
jgi:hypothetical protein